LKVRLLAPDSKIPNLAIMKISTYHKQLGDDVDWYRHEYDFMDTDILYISKVFKFTDDVQDLPINDCKIIRGGTGYDYKSKLPDEIENITNVDYSLYPDCDYSIIFTTRGCVRKCEFCIVPKKEGLIHDIPLCELNPKGKYIKILDNNFFASCTWKQRLDQLKKFNQPLEFNAGIDLRLLTEEQCIELKKCKIKSIHCAWDNYKDKQVILPKLEMLSKYIKPYKILCYVLVGFENKEIVETDIERVNTIWSLGVYPFVMGYINFDDPKWEKSRSVKDFSRWCNNRFIFKSCSWEEYKNRKRSD
jgi:hypothetical protein